MQPIVVDENGTKRFKANAIVRYLIDHGSIDLNTIAALEFPQEDREQFAQLIGTSLSLFGDLPYVSDETYTIAKEMAEKLKYWYEYGDRADDPNLKKSPVFLTELEALRALEYDFEARSSSYFKMFRPEDQK